MNELNFFEIAICILVFLSLPAFLFRWMASGTRYQKEATVLIFIVDLLFTSGLYFSMLLKNQSITTATFIALTIFFLAVTYYKARKFYLHKYY